MLAAAELERGPAPEALRRLLAAGWEELGRNEEIARASAATLTPEAMRRAHDAVRTAIGEPTRRGRDTGEFRADVPDGWLVTAALALIHAAAAEVREGGMERDAALAALTVSVVDLFAGRGAPQPPRARSGTSASRYVQWARGSGFALCWSARSRLPARRCGARRRRELSPDDHLPVPDRRDRDLPRSEPQRLHPDPDPPERDQAAGARRHRRFRSRLEGL